MARALVVAKAKLENDPQYKYIADHRKPMQTRLAQELHQNANVPLSQDKRIYLYMHGNHYDVITKMPGFFACNYYCHKCKKTYNNQEEHRCPNACKCCRFPTECPEGTWLTCPDCHRLFRSQQCFEQHKQTRGNARSVCERLICCTKCQATVRRCKQQPEKHRCGLTKCWICGKYVQLEGHRCYIQPETKKKRKNPTPEEEMPENGYGK